MTAVKEEDRYQVIEHNYGQQPRPVFSSSSKKMCEKVADKGNKLRKPDERYPAYEVRDRFA
ncbi:MAG TPA: hypothetical protein VE990_12390 [Acidimicrobiales bacterium]|nr:hypothetical protein [Acidimicrobiales bacterium]